MLALVHWNVAGVDGRASAVAGEMVRHGAAAALLCETWSYKRDHSVWEEEEDGRGRRRRHVASWIAGPEREPSEARVRGGLGALVAARWAPRVERVHVGTGVYCMWLCVDSPEGEGRQPLHVGEVYAPAGADLMAQRSMLDEVAAGVAALRGRGPLIVLGDFNARVGANGDAVTNAAGRQLLEFAERHRLVVANLLPLCAGEFSRVVVEHGRHGERTRASTIDLLLVPAEHARVVQSLEIVQDGCALSDHRPLVVRVRLPGTRGWAAGAAGEEKEPPRRIWRVHQASQDEWEAFGARVAAGAEQLPALGAELDERVRAAAVVAAPESAAVSAVLQQCVDAHQRALLSLVNEAAGATIGKKRAGAHPRQNDWWDGECVWLGHQLADALRRLQRARQQSAQQPELWQRVAVLRLQCEAVSCRREFRRVCRCKKRDALRVLSERVERARGPKVFWEAVNHLRDPTASDRARKALPPLVAADGTRTRSVADALTRWREHFAAVHSAATSAPPAAAARPPAPAVAAAAGPASAAFDDQFAAELRARLADMERVAGPCPVLDADIGLGEVERALQHMDTNTAPGPDGVYVRLLKGGGRPLAEAARSLFQRILTSGAWPDDWCDGVVVPLHKDGAVADPDNYRGISLLDTMSKWFENVLLARLTAWSERAHVLADEQGGFRPERSTLDQVFLLHELIGARRERQQPTYACFIDVRKAYDRTWRDGLWTRLHDVGVRGHTWRVLRAMFARVRRRVLVNGRLTEPFEAELGVPQGAVLSPFLYSVFIDGLARHLRTHPQQFGLNVCGERVPLLLYADDIVLLESSPSGCRRRWTRRLSTRGAGGSSSTRRRATWWWWRSAASRTQLASTAGGSAAPRGGGRRVPLPRAGLRLRQQAVALALSGAGAAQSGPCTRQPTAVRVRLRPRAAAELCARALALVRAAADRLRRRHLECAHERGRPARVCLLLVRARAAGAGAERAQRVRARRAGCAVAAGAPRPARAPLLAPPGDGAAHASAVARLLVAAPRGAHAWAR